MDDRPVVYSVGSRVHVAMPFARLIAGDHDALRSVASALMSDGSDGRSEEHTAEIYDHVFGADDLAVGNVLWLTIRQYEENREYAERAALAFDLLRKSQRTRH